MIKWIYFWQDHPSLFAAFHLFIGCFFCFREEEILLFVFCLFWLPYLSYSLYHRQIHHLIKPSLTAIFLLLTIFSYTSFLYKTPPPTTSANIKVHCLIKGAKLKQKGHRATWSYQGTIKRIHNSSQKINLPIFFSTPKNVQLLPGNTYLIQGTLSSLSPPLYWFRIKRKTTPICLKKRGVLLNFRALLHNKITQILTDHLSNQDSKDFLLGMATGKFATTPLLHELGSLGLQHIIAISGFHFALIAGLAYALITLLLPLKGRYYFLLIFLALYANFIGLSPSVMRSWIMISLYLLAFLLKKQPSSLNLLGTTACIMIFYDPLFVFQIGFQFSFLITWSLLMFFPIFSQYGKWICMPKGMVRLIHATLLEKYGFLLLSFWKNLIHLSCAVQLTAFPLTLWIFNKYPLYSLIYNLFFPPCISIAIILLMVSLLLFWINFYVFSISIFLLENYTTFILNFVTNSPFPFKTALYLENIPSYLFALYFMLLFFVGVYLIPSRHKNLIF